MIAADKKTNFNNITFWNECDAQQQRALLQRPAVAASDSISASVADILLQVKSGGDAALRELSAKFDKVDITTLRVSMRDIDQAASRLGEEIKAAMQQAAKNIEKFHVAQILPAVDIETQPGVRCQQVTRPLASVGLYIPGGTAPLLSTVLMLGIPARVAGCQHVVLCSPPPIADESFMPHRYVASPKCSRSAALRLLQHWLSAVNQSLKWIKFLGRAMLTSPKLNVR